MKRAIAVLFALPLLGALVSAHIMVSPPQSKPGITQTYELRVHNEGKIATTALDLDIPADITVLSIDSPASGSVEPKKVGDRIVAFTWKVNVEPTKYQAMKFSAKNPATDKEVSWIVHQHLADGTVVEWSDKPGAKEHAAVTRISASTN
ncbi:MAG TPA: DUF1775 domain-containing protein [Vicinamibacterales bacterium]|nr:DUF1775 domain-containing protein [Vicinamibacterales bacterium]